MINLQRGNTYGSIPGRREAVCMARWKRRQIVRSYVALWAMNLWLPVAAGAGWVIEQVEYANPGSEGTKTIQYISKNRLKTVGEGHTFIMDFPKNLFIATDEENRLYWSGTVEDTVEAVKSASVTRICVPPDRVDAWRTEGVEAIPISDADLAAREMLSVPGIASRAGLVSSTQSPWVDANGWRFVRNPHGHFVYELPAGRAVLGAAEASTFHANAVLKIDPADLAAAGQVLAFAAQLPASDLLPVADIAVVDDGTAETGEVMNLLSRRNLLYEPVKARSATHALTVVLGSKKYPRTAAANPSDFALRIRRELADKRRTLRIYGSEVVLARLTGDTRRRRLQLVNYGGRDIEGLRIRLRGSWRVESLSVLGRPDAAPEDVAVADGATELSIRQLGVFAVVDLSAM